MKSGKVSRVGVIDLLEQPTVDFTQGYGSFDFCPRALADRYAHNHVPVGTKPVATKSLNHGQAFPLMKLPLEIRHHIYGHLLHQGIYRQRQESLGEDGLTDEGFRFRLSDSDYNTTTGDYGQARFAVQVGDEPGNRNLEAISQFQPRPRRVNIMELYEAIQNAPPDIRSRIEPPGWASSEGASKGLDSAGADRLDEQSPATSDSESSTDTEDHNAPAYVRQTYCLEVPLPIQQHDGCDDKVEHKTGQIWFHRQITHWKARRALARRAKCTCPRLMRDEYDWIRLLCQVSRRFTCELGSFLWTSATLHVDEPEVFLDFFSDRPALAPLVRRIILDTRCFGDAFDTMTATLQAICEFVSSNMEISAFTVYLDTVLCVREVGTDTMFAATRDNAKALIHGPWADIFRKLTIKGSFEVRLQPIMFVRPVPGAVVEGPGLELLTQELREIWTPVRPV